MSVSKNRHSLPGFSVTKALKKFLRRKELVSRVRSSKRSLLVEALENRQLMAADTAYKHNSIVPVDVNRDYEITAQDALLVINALSRASRSIGGKLQ